MKNQSENNSVYDSTIRLFILVLIVGWCLAIIYPFVSIIPWSLILAMALHPPIAGARQQRFLCSKVRY